MVVVDYTLDVPNRLFGKFVTKADEWLPGSSLAGFVTGALPDIAGFVTRADESLGRIGHFIKIVITPKESLGRMRFLIDWILE